MELNQLSQGARKKLAHPENWEGQDLDQQVCPVSDKIHGEREVEPGHTCMGSYMHTNAKASARVLNSER